eukprot:UN00859
MPHEVKHWEIFCDLDGVSRLIFESGFQKLTSGKPTNSFRNPSTMWKQIAQKEDFLFPR